MHQVFTIKSPIGDDDKDLNQKLHLTLDVYSKRVLYEVSQVSSSDTIRQSKSCYKLCIQKHSQDDKFQNCAKTCFAKFNEIQKYMETTKFQDLFKKENREKPK